AYVERRFATDRFGIEPQAAENAVEGRQLRGNIDAVVGGWLPLMARGNRSGHRFIIQTNTVERTAVRLHRLADRIEWHFCSLLLPVSAAPERALACLAQGQVEPLTAQLRVGQLGHRHDPVKA